MAALPGLITVEQFWQMPDDGRRYELQHGSMANGGGDPAQGKTLSFAGAPRAPSGERIGFGRRRSICRRAHCREDRGRGAAEAQYQRHAAHGRIGPGGIRPRFAESIRRIRR